MKRILGVIGLLALAACVSPDIAARGVGVQPLAATDEGGLWMAMNKAEEDLLRSPNLIHEAELNAYVQDVTCRVAREYCGDLRVYVVDHPYFNAMMAPNGMMQVWSGMLLRTENESQLAFVLGHETAHYVENHSLETWRTAKRSSGVGAAFGALLGSPELGSALGLTSVFGFSRDNERQADMLGLERTIAAGYDPTQAAETWRHLVEEIAQSDSEDVRRREARGSLFSTHPLTVDRIASLEAQSAASQGGKFSGVDRHADMIAPHLSNWLDAEVSRRDYGQCLYLIDRLSARGRDLGVLTFYLGEVYRARGEDGDAERANEAYVAATAHADAPAEAWRQVGQIRRGEGDVDASVAAFETYLSKAPDAVDRLIIENYLANMRGQS